MTESPDELELPIFPLGSVLFPGMPLGLQVFEQRYLAMLGDLFGGPGRAFGVVLIERGHEVGGDDTRFGLGTLAHVAGVHPGVQGLRLVARGGRRFEVAEWRPDDPYPRARVRLLPDLPDTPDATVVAWADKVVRRLLARASEYVDLPWTPDVALPGAGAELLWRLAGIAPLGELDRQRLLAATSAEELATRLIHSCEEAERSLALFGPLDSPAVDPDADDDPEPDDDSAG